MKSNSSRHIKFTSISFTLDTFTGNFTVNYALLCQFDSKQIVQNCPKMSTQEPFNWELIVTRVSNVLLNEAEYNNLDVVFSPLGMLMAIFMMISSATGPTTKETLTALFIPDTLDINYIHLYFQKLMSKYNYKPYENERNKDLLIKNFLLTRFPKVTVNEGYLSTLKSLYHAYIEDVNFEENGIALMDKINRLVSKQTSSQIPNIMTTPARTDAVMEGFNIVTLKNTWTKRWKEAGNMTFYSTLGNYDLIEFIKVKGNFSVKRFDFNGSEPIEMVSLPTSGNISTVAFMPQDVIKTPFEKVLTLPLLQMSEELLQESTGTEYEIVMPKLRIQTEVDIGLILTRLGARHFYASDFEKMFHSPNRLPVNIELNSRKYAHKSAVVIDKDLFHTGAVSSGETEYNAKLFRRRKRDLDNKVTLDHPFLLISYDRQEKVPVEVAIIRKPL